MSVKRSQNPSKENKTIDNPVKGAPAATASRKGPGAKEVPAFEWKVIGESHGLVLTLFKAVIREDADAQIERLRKDGYYENLRVLPIDEPIKQSRSAMAEASARMRSESEDSGKTATAARKSAAKRAKAAAQAGKRPVVAGRTRPAKSAKPASDRKASRKKTAAAKSPRKRPARKK